MSKVQDDEVGDGTTSVTVLAAELLRVNTVTHTWEAAEIFLPLNLPLPGSGGGASDCQEAPPSDHHRRLEEGDSGGQGGSEGGCCRPQVRKHPQALGILENT